jgi:hypothetical protein
VASAAVNDIVTVFEVVYRSPPLMIIDPVGAVVSSRIVSVQVATFPALSLIWK